MVSQGVHGSLSGVHGSLSGVHGSGRLTPQEALALLKADGVGVALLGGGGAVALRHRHDGGSVPHQELAEDPVVAGGGAVQRGPAGVNSRRRRVTFGRAFGDTRGKDRGEKLSVYQPWLSGALTLAPMRTRKSTTL